MSHTGGCSASNARVIHATRRFSRRTGAQDVRGNLARRQRAVRTKTWRKEIDAAKTHGSSGNPSPVILRQ